MHLNSELLFRKYALTHFNNDLKVLEIGPAGIPSTYQKIVDNSSIVWHTLDINNSFDNITYVVDNEYKYPIEGESYDLIICGQVIEHVKKIWIWLEELKRILKKDGILIIINPVSWPYHAFPVDCWRIFPEGMKALCDHCDLEIVFCEFESIEETYFNKTKTPTSQGQSVTYLSKRMIHFITIWNALIHHFPIICNLKVKVEVAYDTITVAKK